MKLEYWTLAGCVTGIVYNNMNYSEMNVPSVIWFTTGGFLAGVMCKLTKHALIAHYLQTNTGI